jgi:hypothetical protein
MIAASAKVNSLMAVSGFVIIATLLNHSVSSKRHAMSLMRDKNLILTNFRRHQRTGSLAPAVKNRQRLTQVDKMFGVTSQVLS